MAHFVHASAVFSEHRASCLRLLAALLVGSVVGALCARLQSAAFSVPAFTLRQFDFFPSLLRAMLFPGLLVVAFLLRRRFLFYVLFFSKGFFLAYVLCAFALRDAEQLPSLLPVLILRALLPLPAHFLVGSCLFDTPLLRKNELI